MDVVELCALEGSGGEMKTCAFLHRVIALAAVAATVSSCTDSESSPVVTIRTGDPPALVAFRDDTAAEWRVLPVDGATTFDIEVTGDYQVFVVCINAGFSRTISSSLHARTTDDERSFEARCISPPFELRGQMVQPGRVAFGGFGRGTNQANWELSLPAARGTFDLILLPGDLTTGPDGIAFRRDVVITGDTDLGTIALAPSDIQPLVPASFTASNLRDDESLFATTTLFAGGTAAPLTLPTGEPGADVFLAPDDVLRPTDRQNVTLGATGGDGTTTPSFTRTIQRDVRAGDATSLALPESLGSVAFETSPHRLVATWSSLPAHDRVLLERESRSSDEDGVEIRRHRILLTRSFLETTAVATATLDFSEVPVFQSEWQLDPADEHLLSLTATRRLSATEQAFSSASAISPAPTSPASADARDDRPRTWWSMPGELETHGPY
jgi:hypothetical protein